MTLFEYCFFFFFSFFSSFSSSFSSFLIKIIKNLAITLVGIISDVLTFNESSNDEMLKESVELLFRFALVCSFSLNLLTFYLFVLIINVNYNDNNIIIIFNSVKSDFSSEFKKSSFR